MGGACRLICSSGKVECSGLCVDTSDDLYNCGACGTMCKLDEQCKAGKCTLTCPAGASKCSGACVDLTSNASHCGACGKGCAKGEACSGGACVGGWAVSVGSVSGYQDVSARSMAADSTGNVYIAGAYSGTLLIGTSGIPSSDEAIFVARLDSALNPVWLASTAGTTATKAQIEDIATDDTGGAYITGCFYGAEIRFGAHTLKKAAGTYGDVAFVARLDNKGKWAWARGAVADSSTCGQGVAADSSGAHVTGSYGGSKVTFGAHTLKKAAGTYGNAAFVASLDRDGKWLWASGASASCTYYCGISSHDIAVDGSGHAAVTGSLDGKGIFGALTLTSKGDDDVFVAGLDDKGAWKWAARGGSTGRDHGNRLTVDASGQVHVTGSVGSSKATFGQHTLSLGGSGGFFVASLAKDGKWSRARGIAVSTFGYYGGSNISAGIAADAAGGLVVGGTFNGTATLGALTLSSKEDDIFVASLGKDGSWRWARRGGSPASDLSSGLTTDSAGNIYTAGHLGSTNMAPHKAAFGKQTLTSSGSQDLFVTKQSSAGVFTRAKKFSAVSSEKDYGLGIARDHTGSFYVTGRFANKATFGAHTVKTTGTNAVFVAKASRHGKWLWAASSSSGAAGYGLAADGRGGAYVTGYFIDKATFGAHTVTASKTALYQAREVFVARVDRTGTWAWAAAGGGTFHDDGHDVEGDGEGNLLVTGCLAGTATFGGATLTAAGNTDLFVAKLKAASGKWLWVRGGGGSDEDCGHGLALDGTGAAYVTGRVRGTATFGAEVLKARGGDDVVVAKVDRHGAWQWITGGGGSGFDSGYGLALDSARDMIVTGSFSGAARFGAFNLASKGTSDAFVGKLDRTGSWRWVTGGGGTSFAHGKGVALDSSGAIHVAGYFFGAARFGQLTLASGASTTPFVARLDASGAWTAAKAPASMTEVGAAHAIVAGPGGNAITTGGFSAAADFAGSTLHSLGKADIFVWHLP